MWAAGVRRLNHPNAAEPQPNIERCGPAACFQRSASETRTRDLRELDNPPTRLKTALGLHPSERPKIFCHERAEFNDIVSNLGRLIAQRPPRRVLPFTSWIRRRFSNMWRRMIAVARRVLPFAMRVPSRREISRLRWRTSVAHTAPGGCGFSDRWSL